MEKIATGLSSFTHDDVVVDVKTSHSQIGIGGDGPGLSRDRRDTGH